MRFQGEQGEPIPVREGMTDRQREDVRWYIEDFMTLPEGGNETRAHRIEQELIEYGTALWQGLSSPQLDQWLGAVQAAGGGRLELRAEQQTDEIAFRTPWELLRVGGGRLLHQLDVTVVRRGKANLPKLRIPDTSQGLRVLTIVCRPEGEGFLDPRYTPEAILTALENRPEVSVDFCRPATLSALVDRLERAKESEQPYHVVHFDGHGTTIPHEGGIGALLFEQSDGRLDVVRATQFGDLMSRFNIPLVVLEACRTATKQFAKETVASALMRDGVGTVMAMGYAVHVDMTRTLMEEFYKAVARGRSMGEALQAARNQVYADKHRRTRIAPDSPTVELQDWFVPQLYQGADDPILLTKKPKKKKKPEPIFAGFWGEPRAGFQGRGHELHRLERLVLQNDVTVIHAPGGMGKTALAREAALWWTRTDMFPDGAIFVSLEAAPSPEAVVSQVGEALEGIDFHQRDNRHSWLEDQLTRRRMLVVWDNYESVLPAFNHGRPASAEFASLAKRWTRGASRLLITSRDAEVGLESRPFALGELSPPEALQLLIGYLERLGVDRSERVERGWTVEALQPVVDKSGGHPLALELLAPQIAKRGPDAVAEEFASLLDQTRQEHSEDRNRSMRASLEFSTRHLSEQTRAALPAVALLAGGFLESMAAHVAGLDENDWSAVRSELERIGLVRVEGPFLRPHPALGDVPDFASPPDLEERFLAVVSAFCREFNQLVRSAEPKAALAAMHGCEAVVRRAIERAAGGGHYYVATAIAVTLKLFLELSGRAGEGAALMEHLQQQVGGEHGELTRLQAELQRQVAWAEAARDPESAARTLQNLASRLERVDDWEGKHALALTLMDLGRVQSSFCGQPQEALTPLQQAVEIFEQLEQDGNIGNTNRSAVLGSLANVLRNLGQFDEAIRTAEDGLALDRERGDTSSEARGLGRIARILLETGRFQEAEERTREALRAAKAAGDIEAEGILWQQLGSLARRLNRPAEAVEYLTKGLSAFQRAGDEQGQMQTFNALGVVEANRGNRDAASAWYERSLEMAQQLGAIREQATARTNRANLLTEEAEEAEDPQTASRLLHQAIAEEREILDLTRQLGQPAIVASSHSNLASDLQHAGLLDEAEQHAREALAISESLGLPDMWKTLATLENIATDRGDATAAAEFRSRKEVAQAAQQERAGTSSLPAEAVAALLQLALTAAEHGTPLEEALTAMGADENLLATMEQRDSWLVEHLRALAGGGSRPAVEVPQHYRELVEQVWSAR